MKLLNDCNDLVWIMNYHDMGQVIELEDNG